MRRHSIFFSFFIIFSLIYAGFIPVSVRADQYQNPEGWTEDMRITDVDHILSVHPDIAVDSAGTAHIVWQDAKDNHWGIYYVKSSDGNDWSTPKEIGNPPDDGQTPSITIEQNRIYVVWRQWESSSTENIYYRRSNDRGDTWGDIKKITNGSGVSCSPKIIANGETLHLIWVNKSDGNPEIYYKKSVNGGDNWSEDKRITYTVNNSYQPDMDIDSSGNIHIVWQEWLDDKGQNTDVYYAKSIDEGEHWDITALTNVSGDSEGPCIIINSKDTLYAFWDDYRGGGASYAIYYRKSNDHGDNWTSEMKLTNGTYWAKTPSIITDSNDDIHLVFEDCIDHGLHYMRSIDKGNTWIESYQLTSPSLMYAHPKIVADSQNILHVVWYDCMDYYYMNETTMYDEIYYKRTLSPVTPPPSILLEGYLNAASYKVNDTITLSGNARYNTTAPVINGEVIARIVETGKAWNTNTDSKGNYQLEIIAPSSVGNYTINITINDGTFMVYKEIRLKVVEESVINGGQQESSRAGERLNIIYIATVGAIAGGVIVAFALLRMRRPEAPKVEKPKKEGKLDIGFPSRIQTMTLRCPECKMTFSVEVKPKPFGVKCPNCGKEGVVR